MPDIRKVTRYLAVLMAMFLFSAATDARPKVGLALGGGGAKGSAHIAVLKVLEENNIPVDYIAGTSIGAIVGGMYATGLTADEVKERMFNTPWDEGYSDRIPRQDLSWRVKKQSDKFNIPIEMGLSKGKITLPSGLLYGQQASQLLREVVGEHPNFETFNNLAIPYRAVATDLVNYKTVVIEQGDLVAAMRASANVPGVLAPVQLDEYLLVDGGITNNLPIDVVRAMGADIIIAVDIGSGLSEVEELNSAFAVLGQLSSFLTSTNSEVQKKLLTDTDILIVPNIEGLSMMDWGGLEEAFNRGMAAANKQVPRLSSLSLDDESYQQHLEQRKKRSVQLQVRLNKPVTEIRLTNNSAVSDALILEKLQLQAGEAISAVDVNAAMNRLYSINEFQRVDAHTWLQGEEKVLQVVSEEKSWGPNFIQMGIGFEDDIQNTSDLSLVLAYTLRNLTENGGELRLETKLGVERSFETDFYLPLDELRQFYSSSRYTYDSLEWDLFIENTPVIPVEQKTHAIFQGLGYNFTQRGYTEVGLTAEAGRFRNKSYFEEDVHYLTYGGYFDFGFDSLDDINFPTQGTYFTFSMLLREENVNEDVEDDPGLVWDDDEIISFVVDANWKTAAHFGNHAFVIKASYAEIFTERGDDSVYFTSLGGFLNLSGYHKDALSGNKKLFSAGIYQFDLGRSFLDQTGLPVYLGISLETGGVWQEWQEMDEADLILASSIYLGTKTMLGPIALGYGHTSTDSQAVYFYLGKSF